MTKFLRTYQSTIYGRYRRAYIIYGTLTGAVLALSVAVQHIVRPDAWPTASENLVSEAILAVAMFAATYHYRSRLPEQKVMLKELLLLDIGMGLVTSVVYGLLLWLLCGIIFPDLTQHFTTQRLALMPPATDGAEAALAIKAVQAYTAGDWGFIGGFRTFVMSILIAFFSALIFRTFIC